jgi:hypothetical protein
MYRIEQNDNEFMEMVGKTVANAIEKQADKEIETLKAEFEREMKRYKGEVVGRIVNGLRLSHKYDPIGRELNIQILLTGEE